MYKTPVEIPLLKDGERLDELHIKGYGIIQNPEDFCYGLDAVLLSAFVKITSKDTVADLCTGNGIIPILLSLSNNNLKSHSIAGIEIQSHIADRAVRSVKFNKLDNVIDIYNCDIKDIASVLKPNSFTKVICNPPYAKAEQGKECINDSKAIARTEISCNLDDVVKAASFLLNSSKEFYLIHRAYRLNDILITLKKYNFSPKLIQFVYPDSTKEASMVLVKAIKAKECTLSVLKPLIVYNENRTYTQDILDIYQK